MKKDIINGRSEAEKEFQRLTDQLKAQSEHNQHEVQKIIEQQEQSNKHFQEVCDKMNENMETKINSLFASFNTAMHLQAQTTQIAMSTAAEGTQKQFKVLDRRFAGIEDLLSQLVE